VVPHGGSSFGDREAATIDAFSVVRNSVAVRATIRRVPGRAPPNAAADRVARVLSSFADAEDDLGVTEIAATLSLDKSVVHRILTTLVDHGFLDRDAGTRRYRVGLHSWEVGRNYAGMADIRRLATPALRRLVEELGGTGYVCKLDGLEIVYMSVAEASGPLRVHVDVGSRAYAHTTAVGKAMLACLPESELRVRLGAARSLPVRTETSISRPAQLLRQLEQVRARRYALNRGEHNRGVGSVGVAIRDASGWPLAGMSVAFPMLEQFERLWVELPVRLTGIVDGFTGSGRAGTA
jgi:DNA-binding IclR family transcriptional regulator